MKITSVTPYLVGPRPCTDGWSEGQIVIFVKLETDTGLVGWGETYALSHRQRAAREIIVELGEALKQMSEATPRAFLHHVAKPMDSKHPGIDYSSAVSAIEIALWDLLGKATGQPVYALLGGAMRQEDFVGNTHHHVVIDDTCRARRRGQHTPDAKRQGAVEVTLRLQATCVEFRTQLGADRVD